MRRKVALHLRFGDWELEYDQNTTYSGYGFIVSNGKAGSFPVVQKKRHIPYALLMAAWKVWRLPVE